MAQDKAKAAAKAAKAAGVVAKKAAHARLEAKVSPASYRPLFCHL